MRSRRSAGSLKEPDAFNPKRAVHIIQTFESGR
jgi:hypothetical protein